MLLAVVLLPFHPKPMAIIYHPRVGGEAALRWDEELGVVVNPSGGGQKRESQEVN
jgi:hypothetical protein